MTQPSTPATHDQAHASWLKGGGEMGRRVREFDWASHPLGSPPQWPQSLKTTVSLLLNSRYAMWMGWGPDLCFFCNDAYLPTLGLKTGWLGTPASTVWSEIWADVGPRAESVVRTGEATWDEGLLLFLERSGFAEETYHTFSYSPVPADDGGVGGMLCVVTEDTERVISERRLSMLRELATRLTGVTDEEALSAAFQQSVALHSKDLPFILVYLRDGASPVLQLACSQGVEQGQPIAPARVTMDAPDQAWPLTTPSEGRWLQRVDDLEERFDAVPQGPWDKPPRSAVLLPIPNQANEGIAGYLVAGINPYRTFDATYQGFMELLGGQFAAALANVRTHEHERRRTEELAAMDRAKTAFFSNVSHELRTPLTLMLSPLEDLLNKQTDVLSAEDHERAGLAHRNGLRLLKLVNTLLDFSRIEAGRMQSAFEPVDLATLTADLASGFRSALEKAGLKFTVECPPLREDVYVDRDLWEKIVLNLLSNAFKFTLQGEIAVGVRDVEEGVELRVSDTGTGISEESQARLFERFYRVHGAAGRSFEGTGIGLALVSELVRLHGGSVTVQSRPGEGSTFTVLLLRGKDHLPQEHVRHGPSSASRKAGASFMAEAERWLPSAAEKQSEADASDLPAPAETRPRVLLADDNADMRDYITSLLAPHFDVSAVEDGQAALEAVRQRSPDLILSDVMMPRLDGLGLLQAVRGDAELRTLPVILLSARAGEESKVEGLDAGADDYLIKPFNARELLARVNVHLTLARIRQESASQVTQATQDLQVRGERMQLLSETLAQLLGARDPDTVVKDLVAKVAAHLRADCYFNFMVDAGGNALQLHSCGGITDEQAAAIQRLEFGQAICGTVAQTCRAIVANDIQNTDYDKADLVRGLGIQTYACHPLMTGGRLLGTLSFASRSRPEFDEDELKFIRIVTNSAALVLEQLKSVEARLHLAAIVASSDDAIISKNLDGLISSWNSGAERIFGYESSEIVGRPVTVLIPEERHHEEAAIMERIRGGESFEHFETVRQRKDGSLVDISLTISPIRDADGKITGVSKIGRDITLQKKNELELVRREQLYRSIGESINYGIWVCDAEGRNLYASDSFLKLVGMTQEECSRFGWGAVLHPDEAEATRREWQMCSREGGLWEKEHQFKGRDGQWHPVLARGIPIRDEAGKIVQWAGINLDISTFKKTEEALRQQSEILAVLNHVSSTLVAERSLEKIVQSVTDASREISGAQFGAFFYNVTNEQGEAFTLYTLSGVPREAFSKFPMPRNTELFGPTFRGDGVIRIDDVLQDPRYGKSAPYHGMPEGHLPVRSYLAIPVVSSSGTVIGGMFFGHSEPGMFKEAVEGILMGMAAQAAIAIDNADLYTSLHRELDQVKRVEAALRASEARWRDLAEAMPHLVWTCGPDGAWDFVSPQWCAYTGSDEAGQAGFGWSAAIHPEDLPRFEKAWNTAAHSRSPLDVEIRIRRADGVYRWFKTRAVPVEDVNGSIVKWYGSNTDIEEIKHTDSVLREREARLSAIFAQAGSGIVQTDLDGRIVMVNDAYCEIVARTRDELLHLNIHAITHPEDRPQNLAVFDAMIRGGSSFIIEKRDVLPDGNYVWVRNSVVGIRDEAGRVVAGLIITQDVTDSREAEDALRASEEQLRLVTDHAPVLLAQIDRLHHYKFVNKPYAERYGFEPLEVIGKHIRDVVGPSAYESALPMIQRAFAGDQAEFEMAIPYDSLGLRWGHVIFVPERNAEGEVVGIVTLLTDITMRKQAEQDLEQARDRALEAVRAKDDFLARLSHELRTPLSPVLLLASEGSSNKDIPEDIRAEFEIIRKNVDLEARLIDDLLDITRITRGKLTLDLKPVDMHDVILDAMGTIRAEAENKDVTLSVRHGQGRHVVPGDAVRLQQVLWNLLSNALKFTPPGGSITLETKPEEESGMFSVQVTDTGIGMNPEELERIFDAFSQGDHAGKGSSQHFGGLGLGLAISRMLVELHQGQISALSAGRGKGAAFRVQLPLLTPSGVAVAVQEEREKAPPPVSAPLARLHILLVEDHEPTRAAVSSLLRRRQHEITMAGSLLEARQCLAQGTFDLLISDLGLPDGTGYDLMAEVGHNFRFKGIAVSGFGMEQDIARSRAAGFVAHLIKPVRIEALERAIAAAQTA